MIRSFVAVGTLLLITGCQAEDEAAAPIRPVQSVLISHTATGASLFTGVVEPQVSTDFSFQILGRLVSREVDVGDEVSAGQLLAAIDAAVLQQNVDAASAALMGANATLANASGVAERQQRLVESNTSTPAELEVAEQALEAARSAMIQAQATLAKAKEQLGYARLSAGHDGIVTAVAADEGQVVAAGQKVLTVARPDLRDAVVDLPDTIASSLKLGMSLQVTLQLNESMSAVGTVREIAPFADPATRSRRVKVALQEPGEGFRLGSIVTVALPGNDMQALLLPARATFEKNGQTWVWVVADEDRVTSRSVRLRRAADGQWIVLDGLETGERVVTAGVNSLVEDQPVKIEEATK